MYFANDQHKRNYESLMAVKGIEPGESEQHEAGIYIVSYPKIYECIDWDTQEFENNPLFALATWNAEDGDFEFHSALTGGTQRMIEVGISLFNGYKTVDLNDVFGVVDHKAVDVLIQAIKIRSRYNG